MTAIPIEEEAKIRAEIASKGFSVVEDDTNGPSILVCDDRNQTIYESLSDRDVAFLSNATPLQR